MNSRFLLLFLAAASSSLAAIETWTNTDGHTMEAELIACHGPNASFRKADGTLYSYPVEKLSDADRARVREFSASNAASTTTPMSAGAASAPQAPAPKPDKLTQDIENILVTLKGSRFSPMADGSLDSIRYYAIYYSAHWCPPCRQFTPDLVKAYKSLKSKNSDFELVFVSSDKDEEAMKEYMKEYAMPWPAVRFDRGKSNRALKTYSARGIPNLVFVSSDGEVLSTSYVDGKYLGPRKVLKDIQAKLK